MLNHEDLLCLLNYEENSGIFSWKKSRRGVKCGIPLGTDNGFGYLRITVLGKSYYAHRLAWFYINGNWPVDQIDHINGRKSDNRIANLREATGLQNQQNKVNLDKRNKSTAMGVSWHKKSNKWQVHICIYKERKYLGLFDDLFEARDAYTKEKEKIKYVSSF